MTQSARILPRQAMIRRQRFATIVPGRPARQPWPRLRAGRRIGTVAGRGPGIDLAFRRLVRTAETVGTAASAPLTPAAPRISLSPRFTLIWSAWSRGVERFERVEREVSTNVLQASRETLATVERSFFRERKRLDLRIAGFGARLSSDAHARPAAAAAAGPAAPVGRTSLVWPNGHPKADRARVVRIGSLACPRWFGTRAESHSERFVTTTVAHRRLTHVLRATEPHGTLTAAGGPAVRPFVAASVPGPRGRPVPDEAAAMRPAPRLHAPAPGAAPAAVVIASAALPHRAADRTFREASPAVQPTPRTPSAAPPQTVSAAPAIDVAKLDAAIWQRFEKRLRIERERRGRS